MEEGSSISDHINAFNKIILDLEDINVKIEDEDKTMILLCSFLSSYEHLVDTLIYGRQALTMVDVKETLSSKAATKKESKEAEGLMARGRSEKKENNRGKQKRSKSRPKNKKCLTCHKEGHFKKDCPDRKNKSRDMKEKTGDATVASESIESNGYDSAEVLIVTNDQTRSKWVLDSDCSFHMCPNKNLFINYESYDGGVVVMENDAMCKVETLSIACYIVNMSPYSGINFKTPIELWTGKPADYSNIMVFGCPAYAHIKQRKLELRALKGVFLGYPEEVKGYKLWCTDLKSPKAIISRGVVFNEVEQSIPSAKQKTIIESGSKAGRNISESEGESEEDQGVKSYQLVRDREKRITRPPKKYAYADLIAFALTAAHKLDTDEPKTYSEAVNRDDSGKWKAAMDEEMQSLIKTKFGF
ncbi:hypothetical protein KPL71_001112 [Citrus sinensis]|uniref:Uncharacterized protein n=1 Tax=Citrus sinensis TaxID=2711 RepID=A0ACB8NVD8_CITSI|nr:hypothetical protein KPL71_001112 [Citrus sinensis]